MAVAIVADGADLESEVMVPWIEVRVEGGG